MMKARTSLWASLAIAASLGLAGCGGSSDDKDDDMMAGAPAPTAVPLPSGHGLKAGTTDLASGPQTTDGGTTLTCTPAEGSTGCSLTVTKDDVLGTYTATATGGTVMVVAAPAPAAMESLPLPAGNTVYAKLSVADTGNADTEVSESITVDPGESEDYGSVRFSCPEGGPKCTVKFTRDANDAEATSGGAGNGMAEAVLISTVGTGGRLTNLAAEVRGAPDAGAGRLGTAVGDATPYTDFGKLVNRLGFPHPDETVNASGARHDDGDTVNRHLKDPDDDAKSANGSKLEEATHKAATSPWAGWTGKAWEGGDQTLVRFDNQSTGMTFAVKYGRKSGSDDDVTPTATTDAGTAFWDLVRATPPAGGTGPRTVSPNVNTPNNLFSMSATFDGVSGTLSCATDCGTLVNDGGNLIQSGGTAGNWKFTATDSTATVTGIQSDYLAFGWWRENSAGGGFADFQPVYGGRKPFSAPSDTLTGKATYTGGAAGNYTKGVGTNERHGGWFIADAKVTATFAGGSGATGEDEIKGTFSNFRGEHGTLGAWNLVFTSEVQEAGGSATAPAVNWSATGSFTGAADRNASPANTVAITGSADTNEWNEGAWGATLYGDNTPGNKLPSGVAGWFHARTDGGRNAVTTTVSAVPATTTGVAVSGSFAATR